MFNFKMIFQVNFIQILPQYTPCKKHYKYKLHTNAIFYTSLRKTPFGGFQLNNIYNKNKEGKVFNSQPSFLLLEF